MAHSFKRLVIIEGDLQALRKKLQKGSVLKGRIVCHLADNRYLLRLFGQNLVMQSKLKFQPTQQVYFKCLAVQPKIQLRVFDPGSGLMVSRRSRSMNIVV